MIDSIAGTIGQSIKRGVPGVPLHALDAIQDENTRQVLQAIVDGWHVRNGSTGSGDGAFVTRSEIDGLVSTKTSQAVSRGLGELTLSPGEISRALADLHSQVFESQLFKALEERVDLIDKPDGLLDRMNRIFERVDAAETSLINETTQRIDGDTALTNSFTALGTRVGTAETAISTEITQRVTADTALSTRLTAMDTRVGNAETSLTTETNQRVNADNALQTTINTQYSSLQGSLALQQTAITTNVNAVSALTTKLDQVQVSVGKNTAAIAAETQARVTADGLLYAQYTLRIDVNGYVSGFGLANNGEESDFIVRTDRFSIVSPTGNQAALIMSNNTINVYDENGALRVRIGKIE